MANKKFSELNLNNAFLFSAVMADSESCRLLLELILGRAVEKVTVHTEHSILLSSDFRSVRLDVFASDEIQVDYNVEMQNESEGNLPKRSRYYQAEIDVASLKPGEDFDNLKPSYVIFICTFDPFGRGLCRYVFENRCRKKTFPLNDGAVKIFLNTKGKNVSDIPQELAELLRYVEDSTDSCVSTVSTAKVRELHDKVKALKRSREWEGRYMRFEELLHKAEKSGENVGKNSMLELIRCMTENGEADRIPRLAEDKDFLEEMFQKYHLTI